MSTVLKVVEILAQSDQSWEDAAQQAVNKACETLKHVESIYIKHFEANVEDGKIAAYRVDAKVTFRLEE